MGSVNRRDFLYLAGAAGAAGVAGLSQAAAAAQAQEPGAPFRLGITIRVLKGQNPREAVARVKELGFSTCQIGFVQPASPEDVARLKAALGEFHVEATAMLAALPGPAVYNFYDGPLTIGLVPESTRAERIAAMKATADMARECAIPAIHTHCGFIPENPNDPAYKQIVLVIREVAQYCERNGRLFYCETGQESPITLLRMIEDVGQPNLFVNLDVANLILYGKGNPVDALDVIGARVRGMHAKDGLFPTDPRNLGKEVPIGEGKVDFHRVIQRLHELNYRGAMTIEREIHGPQQTTDILASKAYLEKMVAKVLGASSGSTL